MILKVISLYDKKINVFNTPYFTHNDSDEDLIESYRRMCANEGIRPDLFDQDVYVLGTYNDKLGSFDLLDKPEFLVSLGDYRYLQEKKDV